MDQLPYVFPAALIRHCTPNHHSSSQAHPAWTPQGTRTTPFLHLPGRAGGDGSPDPPPPDNHPAWGGFRSPETRHFKHILLGVLGEPKTFVVKEGQSVAEVTAVLARDRCRPRGGPAGPRRPTRPAPRAPDDVTPTALCPLAHPDSTRRAPRCHSSFPGVPPRVQSPAEHG